MDLEGFVDAVTGHPGALLPVQGHHKQVGSNQNQKSKTKNVFVLQKVLRIVKEKGSTGICCGMHIFYSLSLVLMKRF